MKPRTFPLIDYWGMPFLFSLIFFLFAVQFMSNLRKWMFNPFRHAVTNLMVAVPSGLILRTAIFPAVLFVAGWAESRNFGLLRILSLPVWVEYPIGFVLLDCSFYYWHILNHRIPLLWRFHNVHHIDLDLDVTTAFRFHYGEMFFSIAFRALQVALFGISVKLFMIFEILFQTATAFHHSNVKLPIQFERLLVKFVVTPRMHGIHHSIVQTETESNFSVIFSIWDRLHRTIRLNIPQQKIRIGVPAYLDPSFQKLMVLLFLPFQKQKQYWLQQDGTPAVRDLIEGGDQNYLAA